MATGVWRKGSAVVTVELDGAWIRIKPSIGGSFKIGIDDWVLREARLRDEGWVLDGSEFPEEESTRIRTSGVVSKGVAKIQVPMDTVLRRKDGKVYLMTRQEGGWDRYAYEVQSEAWVAEKFDVILGAWAQDEHGEYCPVIKSRPCRLVLKPPRPGDRKTG